MRGRFFAGKLGLTVLLLAFWMVSFSSLSLALDSNGIAISIESGTLRSDGKAELLLSLAPITSFDGQSADWWLLAYNEQQGWRSFDLESNTFTPGLFPTYSGPLFALAHVLLLVPPTENGSDTIYFAVDLVADGNLTVDSGQIAYAGCDVSYGSDWWRPGPGTSWQWQLSGALDMQLEVEMYDIDLFNVSAQEIARLKADGGKVVCYFSAGSWEEWREDAQSFSASLLGNPLDGWPDERWLDIRALDSLGPIMTARLDLAVAKGCDGVEPDNVDGYVNDSGFALSADDQLSYNRWLAGQAHVRGLSIGLKNDLDQIEVLLPYFDWALNEQCFEMEECDLLRPFVEAGKAVFGVEYNLEVEEFCAMANTMNFDWLRKNLDLDAPLQACR